MARQHKVCSGITLDGGPSARIALLSFLITYDQLTGAWLDNPANHVERKQAMPIGQDAQAGRKLWPI
jgi:streptomycin 6-kinase